MKGYRFTYDKLGRLKDALYGEGNELTTNPNRFNEQVLEYDKVGNVLGLLRYGQTTATNYGLVDNLNLTYNGSQLQSETMPPIPFSAMEPSLKTKPAKRLSTPMTKTVI